MKKIMSKADSKKTMDDNRGDGETSASERPFMCGVCEGFYGKPWTTGEREELYERMQMMGMNTYLYAPKDDYKHRSYWREVYTEEEASELTQLIKCAEKHNVKFVYALSPGLDITYTCEEELSRIKAKLDQVASFGCSSFALLFDDIDIEMCEADEATFDTIGDAQCFVTNKVYEHLGTPEIFLFCPTEYCDTRAKPDTATSDYLRTIGSLLKPDIDILWTGPKVVPGHISMHGIKAVGRALGRPPVIWDNLHANDYDQTRIYFGPYDGRPPELRQHLRGVLTNPNCEYEANFIAMHTLAQWSINTVQSFKPGQYNIRETSSRRGGSAAADGYKPRKALEKAIADWISVFFELRGSAKLAQVKHNQRPYPAAPKKAKLSGAKKDKGSGKKSGKLATKERLEETEPLNCDDLLILCDLFYLPYEHGAQAVYLLKEAHWLINNSSRLVNISSATKKENTEIKEWHRRAAQFHELISQISEMIKKLGNIPNRKLLYEFYHYITDIESALSVTNSYIKWLALGKENRKPFYGRDPELPTFKGGLNIELKRLLPIQGKWDMFPGPAVGPPSNSVFTIRPYCKTDQMDLYAVCTKTCDDGGDGSDVFPDHKDLLPDRLIGGLLSASPEFCYVLEDDAGICGYVAATPDVQTFHSKLQESWLPSMTKKYAKPKRSKMTPAEEIMLSFHKPIVPLPDKIYSSYPSFMQMSILWNRVGDKHTPRRLLKCIVSLLKSHGSTGIHLTLHPDHQNMKEFFMDLGFDICVNSSHSTGGTVLMTCDI